MKHPIYKDQVVQTFLKVADMLPGKEDSQIWQAMLAMVYEEYLSDPAINNGKSLEELAEGLKLRIVTMRHVINAGHILIQSDASWVNNTSQETLAKLDIGHFHFPFFAGTIAFNNEYFHFAKHEEGLIISCNHEQGVLSVSLIPGTPIAEAIRGWDSFAQESVYVVLSVLLYIATFSKNENRVSSNKVVKAKADKKTGAPNHRVRVVILKQKLKNSSDSRIKYVSGEDSVFSDKSWIVRGHWRNQYYQTTDSHKVIWIDPFWKGQDKEQLEKIYKV